MAPHTSCAQEGGVPKPQQQPIEDKQHVLQPIVYLNLFTFGIFHVGALVGLCMLPYCKLNTILFSLLVYYLAEMGITAGAHRLWSHCAYKARLPFRIFLALCNSMAFQNDAIEWARDHRVHHKFSETDADPHNAKRGFFYAHMGWLLMRKHPLVKEKGKSIDMSDLLRDPVLIWQRRLYVPSVVLLCFMLPTVIPWYYWGEDPWKSYFVCGVLRYVISMHLTWCVNSVAHLWGNKPYDRFINPAENIIVTLLVFGEGFHNYHHVFPQDYSTSEFGVRYNLTTLLLDAMAAIGQVYDRKTTPRNIVEQRIIRTGDGSTGFGYNQSISDKSE